MQTPRGPFGYLRRLLAWGWHPRRVRAEGYGLNVSVEQEKSSLFGTKLRRLREAAGLTQEELAFRAGLTPNAVSGLERGKTRRPYPNTVRSLADALGLTKEERASLLAAVPKRETIAPETPSPVPGASDSSLPNPPTPLLGREQELEELRDLLLDNSEVRLLTLTGIGGVGKTHLAVELAREAEGDFPDGVVFVALAPLRDPALVVPTIARSMGLREGQGQNVADALRAHLSQKQMLLVLDNFEHLLEAAAEVVYLIETCPALLVLATSRAPLRVRGEHEYSVPPLALPSSTQNTTQEEVLKTSSGRLFVQRARATSPAFALTSENAPSVAAICWRLAGLPLALELAAAKARLLEPAALLSRLDQALSTAWARDLPERQRTMRATLDWSYDLLSEPEQRLFRCLSVFAGGFTLEAAEAVGASEEPEEVLDLLGALVEHSLVLVQPPEEGGEARCGMLELVRQYASEKLEESEEGEETRRRHAAFFLDLAERATPELWGARQVGWLGILERENENLEAAISLSLEDGEAETVARFCWALGVFWWTRGHHREGHRWAEAALGGELPPGLRSRVLTVAGGMAYARGDHGAAEARWGEALRISADAGDTLAEGYARHGIGMLEMGRSEFAAAASCFRTVFPIFEERGEGLMASLALTLTGTSLLAQGDLGGARRMFEEGLESARRWGNAVGTYVALYNLAQLALARGDLGPAADALEEGVGLSGYTKDRANLAHFLEALSAVAALRGEVERAAVLIGAAEGSLKELGTPVYHYYIPDPSLRERAVAEARASLGDEAFEEAWTQGREMTFEQAVAYTLSGVDALERPKP